MSLELLKQDIPYTKIPVEIPGKDRSLSHIKTFLAAVAALVLLTALYIRIAWTVSVDSDHASAILMAEAFLHGNYLLHGWTITNCSFYVTDLPFYVVAMAFRGFTPALLHEVPAVIYAFVVVSSVWLAGRGQERKSSRLGMIVTFLLLGLPTALLAKIMLIGVSHVGTTLFVVWGMIALDAAERSKHPNRGLILYAVISALAVLSDTTALVVGVLPVLIVSGVRLLNNKETRKGEQNILLAAVSAVFAGEVLVHLIHAVGGFAMGTVDIIFTPLPQFSENVQKTVGGLLSLFRAYFFGNVLGAATAAKLINLFGIGLALVTFYRGLRAWQQRKTEQDRVTELLVCGIAINLLAYLFSYSTVAVLNTLYSPPERYLVPCYVFMSILVGRYGVEQIVHQRRFQAALAALFVTYGAFFIGQLRQPAYVPPTAQLAAWLEANHLTYGYGNFWASNMVTVVSRNHVKVRAVSGMSGYLAPWNWFSDSRWYTDSPANFVVFDISQYQGNNFYWFGVNAPNAQKTFGPPVRIYQVGKYYVLVWDHDITPHPKQ